MRGRASLMIVFFICAPAMADERAASTSAATSAANTARTVADLERRESALTLRKEVADARATIEGGAHDRLEILLAVFGGLLTLVVILLAISSRDAAINAAKGAIDAEKAKIAGTAQEAKVEAAQAREKIAEMIVEMSALKKLLDDQAGTMRDTIVAEREWLTRTRQEISDMASEIARGKDQAQIDLRMIAHMSVTGAPIREEENQLLLSVIDEAAGIDIQHLSEDQLNAMTANAALKSKWWEMETLARELDRRFGHHPSARCASLFFRALAYSKRKHFGTAIDLYDQLIQEFASFEDPAFNARVGRAMFNRARQFQLQQRYDLAVDHYDKVVRRCADATEDGEVELWVNAQLNSGVCQVKLGKFDNARTCYHAVIKRFPRVTSGLASASVIDAWYNLACSYAREGATAQSIEMLSRWREFAPEHGIDVLGTDSAFEKIRRDPAFVAWIDANRVEDGEAPLLI